MCVCMSCVGVLGKCIKVGTVCGVFVGVVEVVVGCCRWSV